MTEHFHDCHSLIAFVAKQAVRDYGYSRRQSADTSITDTVFSPKFTT